MIDRIRLNVINAKQKNKNVNIMKQTTHVHNLYHPRPLIHKIWSFKEIKKAQIIKIWKQTWVWTENSNPSNQLAKENRRLKLSNVKCNSKKWSSKTMGKKTIKAMCSKQIHWKEESSHHLHSEVTGDEWWRDWVDWVVRLS